MLVEGSGGGGGRRRGRGGGGGLPTSEDTYERRADLLFNMEVRRWRDKSAMV